MNMSAVKLTFNKDSKTWMFQKIGFTGGTSEIKLLVFSSEELTPARDLKFGYILYKNGAVLIDKKFPEFGYFETISREPVDVAQHEFLADHEYVIKLQAELGEEKIEQETTFTVPRPTSPYPSWVWDGDKWAAPVEQPNTLYPFITIWNETERKWDIVDIATTLP